MSVLDFDRSSIEFLRPFFTSNPKFEQFYTSASPYERATLWTRYQDVLSQKDLSNIQGIKEKLGDASSESKLVSTLSELRIAAVFAELGFQVQLIPDTSREWKSPPDLMLTNGSFRALVEITRWAPDNTSELIYKLIAPTLEASNLVLRFSLSTQLSNLVVSYQQRECREKALETFAQELINLIDNLDQTTLPLCGTIYGVDIKVERAKEGWGRIGSWNTTSCFVSEDAYEKQLIAQLARKIEKPLKWFPVQQKEPYFIAIEVEQEVGQNMLLPQIFYGGRTFVKFMKRDQRRSAAVVYPQIVEERLKTSWRDLLLTLGYDSTRRRYISRPGFLPSNPNSLRVCGIIVLNRGSLSYYPNPFADITLLRSDYDQLLRIPPSAAITTHDCRVE